MAEHSEVKSDNARNVILSYGDSVYFVSKVNVQVGDEAKLKAVFHAKRIPENEPEDLSIEINQQTYDVLTEYAKLNKLDLILVLQILAGGESKWCMMSDNWLANQAAPLAKAGYIV